MDLNFGTLKPTVDLVKVGKEVIVDLAWDLVSGAVFGWTCNALSEIHGVDDYCNYVVQQAIAGLAISGRYKVVKYFYKDTNYVPPYSYMCNNAPYAYYKYKMMKVYFE